MHDDCVFSLCLALWNAPNVSKRTTKDKRTLLMEKYQQFHGGKPKNKYSNKSYDRNLGF